MAILRTHKAASAQPGPQAQWRLDEAGGAVRRVAELAGVSGVNLNQLMADGNLELV